MARKVLHLSRVLKSRPVLCEVAGVTVRNFEDSHDIASWLDLRRRAFKYEALAVRDWDADNFQAEFLAKPWWSPQHLWFAEAKSRDKQPVGAAGAIAMAMRAGDQPVIHWLMVLPEWRRRGVGRLLLNSLEVACWDAGYRRIGLESHAAWSAAVEFYRAMGYVEM